MRKRLNARAFLCVNKWTHDDLEIGVLRAWAPAREFTSWKNIRVFSSSPTSPRSRTHVDDSHFDLCHIYILHIYIFYESTHACFRSVHSQYRALHIVLCCGGALFLCSASDFVLPFLQLFRLGTETMTTEREWRIISKTSTSSRTLVNL